MKDTNISYLKQLESESIHIIREVAAEFKNPVMLYSIGKDSSVMVRLAQKAFYPGKIPFPLMHIDTGYKFTEMIEFRDWFVKDIGCRLIIEKNEVAISEGTHPQKNGVDKCCAKLKTQGLLGSIKRHKFDAAFGGARRDEEKSRAKERIFSFRDEFGQWDPKYQRPELWNLYNCRINEKESIRVFPLSNWTEMDVWYYLRNEKIPIVPIYYAQEREVVDRGGVLIPYDDMVKLRSGEKVEKIMCRFRSLGCSPCTGAVRSEARTIDDIIKEVEEASKSERENRIIDMTSDSSMEDKKKEGYF
ncbi:MAG: sulfate adenylyltransferase subunit CysD [Candidatus Scalindua rubra]|uniref:Sulfate adenylyltransferase subunit 2 n=1 Tax=Candidatus Scalindua brodae TaxID=237368 RepID=A0A0B0EBZ4_9BACT|nr:MAG: phosphoadenosine phosphosulfate reductase (PAPS reductase) [Candidatus Scalindua brodae]MBZ0110561.1 sulfate adenylyltransferase subunit CysD [Candidatus Scalindua rubra]